MQNLAKRLEKKGWNKKEISKALGIIKNAKENKSDHTIFLEKRVYWILLVIIVTANFAISIALLPLLIVLRDYLLYSIIIIMGLIFGLVFELVIRSIEHLQRRHHVFLAFLIPSAALISAFIISKISNDIVAKFGLSNYHIPFLIAFIYALAFVAPYILYRFVLKIEYYSKE
ncbi:MAG TPA: hypothetical protein VJI97_03935 [Candidatus Nanoarchaeia archaeon]|nr:hypothetical protein [Candidatus Nanoarchaeia archaeon]